MQIWSKFLNFNLENRSELVTMDGLEYLGDYSIETWPGSLQLSCFLANRHLQIMYVIKPVTDWRPCTVKDQQPLL